MYKNKPLGASHPVNIEAKAGGNSKQAPKDLSANNVKKPVEASLPYDFVAVNGLRVVACLAVICFHSLLYWGTLLDMDKGRMLLDQVLGLRLANYGNVGVDIFLVLTGMWATWQLVPALEAAARTKPTKGDKTNTSTTLWLTISQYYRKRVLRVLPAYATALALVAFGIDHTKNAPAELRSNHDTVFEYCPRSLVLNFVLLNNVIGFGGCGVHFWSLAVQIHFYLAFPLLLWWAGPSIPGFRKRVAIGAVFTFIATALLRYAAAHVAGVTMPLTPYGHPNLGTKAAEVAVRYYHTLYFSTPARFGNLATGVLLALAFMDPKMKSAVQQHPIVVKSLAGFGCAAILVGANSIVLSAKPFGHIKEAKLWKYPKLFAAFAYHGSPLYCLASAALVLALALHSGPLATLAARLLSSKPIRHLEMVSYDVYLLHMAALYWWEAGALRLGGSRWSFATIVAENQVKGYGAILAATCIGGYLAGLVHMKVHAWGNKVVRSLKQKVA